MNDQRRVIFDQRVELMEASPEEVSETTEGMRHETIENLVRRHIPERTYAEQWTTEALRDDTRQILNLDLPVVDWAKEEGVAEDDIRERMTTAADAHIADKRQRFGADVMTYVERSVVLQTIDALWREHLVNLDHLRSVIGFRGYAQRDPLNEYKSEAFELFQTMLGNMRERVTTQLMQVKIVRPEDAQMDLQPPPAEAHHIDATTGEDEFGNGGERMTANFTPPSADRLRVDPNDPATWSQVGRNEPCPCGSGKKFKHCHGAYA